MLDHHVPAAPVGQRAHFLRHLLCGVVQPDIGAELLRFPQLRVARARDDDLRPLQLGDAQRGERHAAANPPDEHRLAGPHSRSGDHHTPRSEGHQRKRSGFSPADGGRECRDDGDILLGHDDALSDGPRQVLAEQPVVDAQRVLAGAAVLAAIVRDPRVDHDAVARPHRPYLGSRRLHHAGAVRPQDVREAVLAGQAPHDMEIEVVERGGAQRDADLARPHRRGVGHIGEVQLVEAAGSADDPGAHTAGG